VVRNLKNNQFCGYLWLFVVIYGCLWLFVVANHKRWLLTFFTFTRQEKEDASININHNNSVKQIKEKMGS
jgi:hypothetical protein